jgi:hypothetical protein
MEQLTQVYAAAKCAVGEKAVFVVSPERAVSLELLFTPVFENLSRRGRSSSCENGIRREQASRKKLTETDIALLEALDRLVDPLARAGSWVPQTRQEYHPTGSWNIVSMSWAFRNFQFCR